METPHGGLWLGPERGFALDWATQQWVKATGRRLAFDRTEWLQGPVGAVDRVGDGWLPVHAEAVGAVLRERDDAGLLPDMSVLDGQDFHVASLRPEVREFYEHTARWRLDVWSQWSPLMRLGGVVLSALFARRLQQLNLPLNALDVSHGMTSRVLEVVHGDGTVAGTAWIRTLRTTGDMVFGGYYGTTLLPAGRRAVRVVFPLPNGSVTVLLRPTVRSDGSLVLSSPRGAFGEEGAYLVVRRPGEAAGWVRRVPLPETFHVFVDDDGVLRTDHELRLWSAPVLRLHYRLNRT
ncbi:MAG: hypothetical protein M3O70_25480 [Actinomycetota bacterium]|nr:hypothetical protein [Actinomycetota bacterium]